MIIINLPPPSAYKQVTFPQPSWRGDVSITRKSNPDQVALVLRTGDKNHKKQSPRTLRLPSTKDEECAIGLTVRRDSAQLIVADERQNVFSRNASFVSATTEDFEKLSVTSRSSEPIEQLHHKPRLQIRVCLPRVETISSATSQSIPQPKPMERLVTTKGLRSLPALPSLKIGPLGKTTSRMSTPESLTSASSVSLSTDPRSISPRSYRDTLSMSHSHTSPPPMRFNNDDLKNTLGDEATLFTRQKTLEMYRANVKKTKDIVAQYSFAVFLVETAQELTRTKEGNDFCSAAELLTEARQIFQRLAEKGCAFAQYYLADGYASGLFGSNGKVEDDKALQLFTAASKHGHAEAGYRAGCCYEFGWGSRIDHAKAMQFYRQSATKNHVGSMTRLSRAWIYRDLGGGIPYLEGYKWLKRATVSANKQYNTAPYDLGCLHETGYGNYIFKDEAYATQLFTQAAELDHTDAAFRLGQAYELGKLSCPEDPGLSIRFYAMAANRGHAPAMFALCAWYMVGADSVIEKDEIVACEWAKKAAQLGYSKAQYAVAYFAEVGIGRSCEALKAGARHAKATDLDDMQAIERIRALAAASNNKFSSTSMFKWKSSSTTIEHEPQKKWKHFKTID